jgi:hypothetical protein
MGREAGSGGVEGRATALGDMRLGPSVKAVLLLFAGGAGVAAWFLGALWPALVWGDDPHGWAAVTWTAYFVGYLLVSMLIPAAIIDRREK